MPEILLRKGSEGSYEVETPSGVVKFGGKYPSPVHTVAASLAGCLAMSLSQTLNVMRQKLEDIEIRMSYEREEEEPKIFSHFNIHFLFKGENLSPAKLENAIHLSEESVCPISVILSQSGAQMRTTFIVENKPTS